VITPQILTEALAGVRKCPPSGNTRRVAPARRIVVAFAACGVIDWALAVSGVTRLPPTPYIVLDIALDVLVVVGLWMLYRPAWRAMVGLTALAEISFLLHPIRNAVLILTGMVQLGLLLHPALRRGLSDRRAAARI
jgi:hypothetical protein